jgi:hypothetical protein
LKHYEEQFQTFRKTGMFYYGVKKDFRGNVDKSTFFSTPGLIINTFGYYRNDDETWVVFVTDDERGIEIKRKKLSTEEEAIEYLVELFESRNSVHYSKEVNKLIEQFRPLTELSSLPFVVSIGDENKLVWFNYYLDQTDKEMMIFIRNILSTEDGINVAERKVDMQLTTTLQEYGEPTLDENQYYALLEKLPNHSYEHTMQLISKAEIDPLLIAYQAVIQYLQTPSPKRKEDA